MKDIRPMPLLSMAKKVNSLLVAYPFQFQARKFFRAFLCNCLRFNEMPLIALFVFWAAKPGLPDYVIQAGFPFVVVSCRLVFVSGTGASYVSLRPPTKTTAASRELSGSTSYHFNPCPTTSFRRACRRRNLTGFQNLLGLACIFPRLIR